MRIVIAFLLLLLIFIFPQTVFADDLDYLEVFHHAEDADGDISLASYKIRTPTWLTTENRALVVFTEVFNNIDPDKMIFAPRDVVVLDVFFFSEYSHLVINLSAEIMMYGGTYFEYRLVEKLLANAAAMPDVAHFTVWVDGQPTYLPEGTRINAVNVV